MITSILIGLGVSLIVAWLAFGACVFAIRPSRQPLGETLRILPGALRLVIALYRDRTLPRSLRWRLRIALIYNVQPINLIPDFVPLIGFADNMAVLGWALRGAVRISGVDAVERNWRGSRESLGTLYRVLRLSAQSAAPTAACGRRAFR